MNMRYLLVRSAAATAIFDVTLIDRFAPHQTINHHPSSSSAAAGDRLVDEKATYLAMCKKQRFCAENTKITVLFGFLEWSKTSKKIKENGKKLLKTHQFRYTSTS